MSGGIKYILFYFILNNVHIDYIVPKTPLYHTLFMMPAEAKFAQL
jgi:hypothetical protein